MLRVTYTGLSIFKTISVNGNDIFEAISAACKDHAEEYGNDIATRFDVTYIHKFLQAMMIERGADTVFFSAGGIECYGVAREDATYEVKCEDEEDDFIWPDTAGNSWPEVISFFNQMKAPNAKIAEICSDFN